VSSTEKSENVTNILAAFLTQHISGLLQMVARNNGEYRNICYLLYLKCGLVN
jgi:hypothetical protein